MIRRMVRLSLWGVESRRKEIIRGLFDLGVLHIDSTISSLGNNPSRLRTLQLLRGKVLGLLESLSWDEWDTLSESDVREAERLYSTLSPEEMTPEIEKSLDEFGVRLVALQGERTRCEDDCIKLKKTKDTLDRFSSFFQKEETRNEPYALTLWWIQEDVVQSALSALHTLSCSLGSADVGWREHHFISGKDTLGVLALSVPLQIKEQAERVLVHWKALPWRLPEYCGETPVERSIPIVKKKIQELSDRISSISADIAKASSEWGPRLAALFLFIDERTEQAAVDARLDSTTGFFSLQGWLPEDALERTANSLKGRFGDGILLQWRRPGESEWNKVPTSLKNFSFFAPFEVFLKLLRPPSYMGVDPTSAVALFFPFFSGCMIGDMGYGIVILFFSLWLKKKREKIMQDIGAILFFLSIWSIVWGTVWGEFFGDVGHRLFHLKPLWVERSMSVMPVLVFTVALGAAHVFLGLLIGIYQGIKQSHRHLWMEKGGNLLVLLALVVCLVLVKSELPGALFTIPLSFFAIGFALLVAGGGIGGIIETLGSIGSIISYVRIAAIGLSSAILALVASKFLDIFGLSIFGVFLALMIHLLNFVLAIGGSGLHSARLHYVEFFGKFYSGNGKEYTPFQRRSGSSWRKHL